MKKALAATATICSAIAMPLAADPVAVKAVAGDLPGEVEFEALAAIEALQDGDVAHLDLNMLPLAWPGLEMDDGTLSTPDSCAFGMIETAGRVSVPTGSNHLLMSVRLGAPETFAANGLSCEYGPAVDGAGAERWARMRLTGCFLVREVSIPTARQLVLNPLPASACGLHD